MPRPARPQRPEFALNLENSGNSSAPPVVGSSKINAGTTSIRPNGSGIGTPSGSGVRGPATRSTPTASDETQHWTTTKEVLGEGALAIVELVLLDEAYTEKYFQVKGRRVSAALKTSKVNSAFSAPLKEKIRREKEYANRKCTHPNLVKYLKVFDDKVPVRILMEFMDLSSLTTALTRFESNNITTSDRVELCRSVGLQALLGLQYLHTAEGLMHRDVKTCNILLSTEGRVKVCDFDTARKITKDGSAPQLVGGNGGAGGIGGGLDGGLQADTVTGTQGYMAPEVVKTSNYDGQCDVWSLGAMLFQIATNTTPYTVSKCKKDMTFSSMIDFSLVTDPDLKDFLLSVLVDNPKQRLTISQAISHKFFASVYEPNADLQTVLKKDAVDELRRRSVRIGLVSAEEELMDLHEKLEEYRQLNHGTSKTTTAAASPSQPAVAAASSGVGPSSRSAPATGSGSVTPPGCAIPQSPTPMNMAQTPPVSATTGSPAMSTPSVNLGSSGYPDDDGETSPRSSGSPTSLRNNTTGDMSDAAAALATANNDSIASQNTSVSSQNNSMAGASPSPPQGTSAQSTKSSPAVWNSVQKNGVLFMMKRVIYKRQEKAVKLLQELVKKYKLTGIEISPTSASAPSSVNKRLVSGTSGAAHVPASPSTPASS